MSDIPVFSKCSLLSAMNELEKSFHECLLDKNGIYILTKDKDVRYSDKFKIKTEAVLMGGYLSHYVSVDIGSNLTLVITYGEDISIKANPVGNVLLLNVHIYNGSSISPLWNIEESYQSIVASAILRIACWNNNFRLKCI